MGADGEATISRSCRLEPIRATTSASPRTDGARSGPVRRSRARAVTTESPPKPSGRVVSMLDVRRTEPGRLGTVARTGSLGPEASGRNSISSPAGGSGPRRATRPGRHLSGDRLAWGLASGSRHSTPRCSITFPVDSGNSALELYRSPVLCRPWRSPIHHRHPGHGPAPWGPMPSPRGSTCVACFCGPRGQRRVAPWLRRRLRHHRPRPQGEGQRTPPARRSPGLTRAPDRSGRPPR